MEQAKFRKLKVQDGHVVTETGVPVYEPEVSLSEIKKGNVFVKVGTPGLWEADGHPVWPDEDNPYIMAHLVRILEDGRLASDSEVLECKI